MEEMVTYKQKKALWFIYKFNSGLPKDIIKELYDWYNEYNSCDVCMTKKRASEIINIGLPIAQKNNHINDLSNVPKPSEKECCANCKYAQYEWKGHWEDYFDCDTDECDDDDYIFDYLIWNKCLININDKIEYNSYRVCPYYEPMKIKQIKEINSSIVKYIKKESI